MVGRVEGGGGGAGGGGGEGGGCGGGGGEDAREGGAAGGVGVAVAGEVEVAVWAFGFEVVVAGGRGEWLG